MEKAIIYFSRDGNTRIAAEYLARKFNAVAVLLKPKRRIHNFFVAGFLSASQKRVQLLGNPWEETQKANILILAAPVWAGKANPVLNSFIDKADFTGKTIYILAVQADPNLNNQKKFLTDLSALAQSRGGSVSEIMVIQGGPPGKTTQKEDIYTQIKDWEIR